MPKSKVRKKTVYTPPAEVRPSSSKKKPSPQWVPILAVVLLVLGIAWLVTYYLSQAAYPLGLLGFWNLAVGFGMLVLALIVLTQWR